MSFFKIRRENILIYLSRGLENLFVNQHITNCVHTQTNIHINRLLYEYGEILTRVSIAVTRACECHANANECHYFSIYVQ